MTQSAERSPSVPVSSYRPDIDGLRAIAVLSVIVFHLDKALLPGGFVGVDIFFVISGYLITSHIVDDIARGRFSLAGFYARRIKRIAPAMLVVVGLTLVAAKLLMLPDDAAAAAKSGVWSLSSLANVFFWRYQDAGYFAAQGKDLPLLHLWSLGVEEQFYLIWPLFLLLLFRAGRARSFLVGMAIVAVASFALGNALFSRNPSFVYYMLPTRAGELLMGAIAGNAIVKGWSTRLPRSALTVLAIAGLLLLAASLLLLDEGDVFPGVLAVPPTLGTALLIFTGRDSAQPIARLASWQPLVWVGLISYSAYLWHWPLFTMYRYGYGDIGLVSGIVLFVLTLLLAWLSYRLVESPARRSKATLWPVFTRQYALPAAVIGTFALAVIYADRVWPSLRDTPYRKRLAALQNQSRPAYDYPYVCQRQKLTVADVTDTKCVVGPASTDTTDVLLWGDSNAAHYIGVVGAFARLAGFRFRNVEVGNCPPLLVEPAQFVEARREGDCVASLAVARPVIARARIVIISASWTDYQQRSGRFLSTFYETVHELTADGAHVILIGKAPVLTGFDRRCREKSLTFPMLQCPVVRGPLSAEVATMNAELQRFAARTLNVQYFDANAYLCPKNVCSTQTPDGELLYYDTSHLSLAGSWTLGGIIAGATGVPAQFSQLRGM